MEGATEGIQTGLLSLSGQLKESVLGLLEQANLW
jgi:hypothetical protein